MAQTDKKSRFTEDEEKYIQAEVEARKQRQRQAELESEIQNRILDEQRKQPGYTGY